MITHQSSLIEEKLTTLILNRVFLVIAGGFVASGTAKGSVISSTFAYQVSVWFLYQILFLLYAEDRCASKTDNRIYNPSISQILTQFFTTVNQKQKFSATSTEIYKQLLAIFKQVNSGEFLQYSGELFIFSEKLEKLPSANQFLLQNQLNNLDLALILDLLTQLDGDPINYKLLNIQYLGTLYQTLLEYHLEIINPSLGEVILTRNQSQRKLTASYYTPDYIVREIVRETLTPILQQRGEQLQMFIRSYSQSKQPLSNSELQKVKQKALEILLNFKVCDLSMGSGHFLGMAVDFITTQLITILKQFSQNYLILEQLEAIKTDLILNWQKQGISVNPNQITVEIILRQSVIKHCIYGVDIDAIAVELAKFSLWVQHLTQGVSLFKLETHLYCANAVTHLPWQDTLKFDAIIGNPPYAILTNRKDNETLNEFKYYLKHHPELQPCLGGKLDLFKIFIILSIRLVREQGFIGLIVPMSLLGDQQSSRLRKFILSDVKIIKIHAFPQKDDPNQRVFQDAKLPTCIIYLQKIKPDTSNFSVIVHPGKDLNLICGQFQCNARDITLFNSEQCPIPLLKSNGDLHILRKLNSNPNLQTFNEICPTYQGEINETKMAQFLSLEVQSGQPILRGGNIQRYEFISQAKQGKTKYLNVQNYQKMIQGDRIHHGQQLRIGYQRNAALDSWKRLLFAPLPCPCYCFDSISYFLVQDQRQALTLLAILNSKLMEWRFQITSSNNHVSTAEVAALPIPKLGKLTGSKLQYSYFQPLQTYDLEKDDQALLNTVQTYIDCDRYQPIYLFLADLAKQMINLHQQKQLEMKRFLQKLLDELEIPLSSLASKTKLMNYLGNYQKNEPHLSFSEFWHHLNKNRSLNLSSISFQNQLEMEYRGSLEKLLPLKNQLFLTDRLIDAVIYRLYGLTLDEIKIIEERLARPF